MAAIRWSGIGRGFLAVGLTVAGMGRAAPAGSQEHAVPNFGTTVVAPGGFRGVIYAISPNSEYLPDFRWLKPLGVIYTSTLNVPTRNFREGFPGVTDRLEWFGIDYSAQFWIEKPGTYRFELTSDDGSRLYIDDRLVVNDDGLHAPETESARYALAGGIHRIRVSYFQGPGGGVALVLRVAGPDEEWRIFSTDEFKPPADPSAWMYLGQLLHVSSVATAPGEKVRIEVSLESHTAKALTAVTWELVFPAELMEREGSGPETGSAARDSGKSLTCAARRPYSYSCTLSGGANPVANGPIAIFYFKIRTTAEAGTTPLRIEKGEAVTVDSKALTLNDAEGKVTIGKR